MNTPKNNDENSDGPRVRLVPQPGGRGALNSVGTPGNRGGGRPSNEFKRRMRVLASSEAAFAYLEQCIDGHYGPAVFLAAHKYVTERGYGRISNVIEGHIDEPIAITITHQLPVDEAVRIATAVANALQHAHERGVRSSDGSPHTLSAWPDRTYPESILVHWLRGSCRQNYTKTKQRVRCRKGNINEH